MEQLPGREIMGVELASERPGFSEMEDVNFTDSELVYHVRDALRSVTLVSINADIFLADYVIFR